MKKNSSLIKKMALAVLVLVIGLAVFPVLGASAQELQDPATPPANKPDNTRLESIWAREQAVYERQGNRLAKAEDFINRIQGLIDKATAKGWDTAAVQAALDDFKAVIPAAEAAHEPGAAIIEEHAGFNPVGKVINRDEAIETVKALHQVNKATRTAMNGTGMALREAIRDLLQANRKPVTTTP